MGITFVIAVLGIAAWCAQEEEQAPARAWEELDALRADLSNLVRDIAREHRSLRELALEYSLIVAEDHDALCTHIIEHVTPRLSDLGERVEALEAEHPARDAEGRYASREGSPWVRPDEPTLPLEG